MKVRSPPHEQTKSSLLRCATSRHLRIREFIWPEPKALGGTGNHPSFCKLCPAQPLRANSQLLGRRISAEIRVRGSAVRIPRHSSSGAAYQRDRLPKRGEHDHAIGRERFLPMLLDGSVSARPGHYCRVVFRRVLV